MPTNYVLKMFLIKYNVTYNSYLRFVNFYTNSYIFFNDYTL